jgi:hypothetical protein
MIGNAPKTNFLTKQLNSCSEMKPENVIMCCLLWAVLHVEGRWGSREGWVWSNGEIMIMMGKVKKNSKTALLLHRFVYLESRVKSPGIELCHSFLVIIKKWKKELPLSTSHGVQRPDKSCLIVPAISWILRCQVESPARAVLNSCSANC